MLHGQTTTPQIVITFDHNDQLGIVHPIQGVFIHDVGDLLVDEFTPLAEWGADGETRFVWPLPLDRLADDQLFGVFYQWSGLDEDDRLEVSDAGYIDIPAIGPPCDNGIDEDGDGWVDEDDPDCWDGTLEAGFEASFECNDGLDNDGEGGTDSADEQCERADGVEAAEADCTDGIDNDLDNDVDCMDWDCLFAGNQCWCEIHTLDPDSADQASSITVEVMGDNFENSVDLDISFGPGVVVNEVTWFADWALEADIAVTCDAPAGAATVEFAQPWEPEGTDCTSAGRACFDGFEMAPGRDAAAPAVRLACRLTEAAMAVDRACGVATWRGLAADAGLRLRHEEDLTSAVLPNMRRFEKLSRAYFRCGWLTRALLRTAPESVNRIAIAGLLMLPLVRAGIYAYRLLILERTR